MTAFQHIRLELAREPGHPDGDPGNGWDIVAPLDDRGRLDLKACLAAPERCFVRRFVRDATVGTGRLRHRLGDQWHLDIEGGETLDGRGYRLGEEQFVLGEYVSIIAADGRTHTYGVKRLLPVDGPTVEGPDR